MTSGCGRVLPHTVQTWTQKLAVFEEDRRSFTVSFVLLLHRSHDEQETINRLKKKTVSSEKHNEKL